MKKLLSAKGLLSASLLLAGFTRAQAADPLTLQLKWVLQAQFAGYYVAQAKGFYRDAGLDVTIKPGSPDANTSQLIAGGGANVIVDWMPSALAAREKGVPLVNIAQVFERSGMELTCRRDSGIKTPADFPGKTLGVWFSGNEYPFLAWISKLKLATTGGPTGIAVLKQGFNVDPLLQNQAACISTMAYNEDWQLIDAKMKPEQLVVFKYEAKGMATLEDGLYTTEAKLADKPMANRLSRFIKTSMQGWSFAIAHQEEAVQIILQNDTAGVQAEGHQARMMAEGVKLIPGGAHDLGYLDEAAYNRTGAELMAGQSDPVITKVPQSTYTRTVWEGAGFK